MLRSFAKTTNIAMILIELKEIDGHSNKHKQIIACVFFLNRHNYFL